MNQLEWKWGLIIGGIAVGWLVASWAMGLHAGGLSLIQFAMGFALILNLIGFLVAMSVLFRREPELGFVERFRSGAMIAVIAALVIAGGQAMYLLALNPGWPDHMAELFRSYSAETGSAPSDADQMADLARSAFGLRSSVIQAGMAMLIEGVFVAAFTSGLFYWRHQR